MRGLDARRRHDGVDLPRLTIAVSRGDKLPAETAVGQPGVRMHGSLALMLGAAERVRQSPRRAALDALLAGFTDRGQMCGSREVLTPLRRIRNRACRSSWAQHSYLPGRVEHEGSRRRRSTITRSHRRPSTPSASSQHRRPQRARQSRNELLTGVAGGSWPSQRAACGITRGGHVLRQVCGLQ